MRSLLPSNYSRISPHELPVYVISEDEGDGGEQERQEEEPHVDEDDSNREGLYVFEEEDVESNRLHVFEIEDVETQEEEDEESKTENFRRTCSPPLNYVCPLTLQLMEDPVNDCCGHIFERAGIYDWLEHHAICPISRKPLQISELSSASILNATIQKWKDRHQDYHYDDLTAVAPKSGHSQFELMLLPQELSLLRDIKRRAMARRKQQEKTKCLWTIAIMITAIVFLVCTFVVTLNLERRKK